MRYIFSVSLASFLMATSANAQSLPNFDSIVSQYCQKSKECLEAEAAAHNALAREWETITTEIKGICIIASVGVGAASYVNLQECVAGGYVNDRKAIKAVEADSSGYRVRYFYPGVTYGLPQSSLIECTHTREIYGVGTCMVK